MRFGPVPLGEAEGAILAHSHRAGGALFKKGRVLSAGDVAALGKAGLVRVMVARLEDGDVPEDDAASRIAAAAVGENARVGAAFTGRANLYAEAGGLALVDSARVDAINAVHEAVTIASVPPFEPVEKGRMLATVKIIPFAAPGAAVAQAVALCAGTPPIAVARLRPLKAALVCTRIAGMKESLLDKNRAALESRLARLGGTLVREHRVAHATEAIANALKDAVSAADILLVFGASAIVDRRDVVPAGIAEAGGTILHFGMPVDPGNLLLLARLGDKPVVGLPGCARSPKRNGFDFVLERLFAGVTVAPADLMRMGTGGLLKEIASRPQPREGRSPSPAHAPRIAAIVLAAGLSSRMGANKLLADYRGAPLVVHVASAALASAARPVIVVTGHDAAKVEAALAGLDVRFARNPDYADGLSTSLKVGVAALPAEADGALVCLGDMPDVGAGLLDKLIAAFDPAEDRAICVATRGGRRGNPVLWARHFFPEIMTVEGDTGAKHLIGEHAGEVCEVEAGDDAPLVDVDTPEALARLRARVRP